MKEIIGNMLRNNNEQELVECDKIRIEISIKQLDKILNTKIQPNLEAMDESENKESINQTNKKNLTQALKTCESQIDTFELKYLDLEEKLKNIHCQCKPASEPTFDEKSPKTNKTYLKQFTYHNIMKSPFTSSINSHPDFHISLEKDLNRPKYINNYNVSPIKLTRDISPIRIENPGYRHKSATRFQRNNSWKVVNPNYNLHIIDKYQYSLDSAKTKKNNLYDLKSYNISTIKTNTQESENTTIKVLDEDKSKPISPTHNNFLNKYTNSNLRIG